MVPISLVNVQMISLFDSAHINIFTLGYVYYSFE